jgi:hypothetical protein
MRFTRPLAEALWTHSPAVPVANRHHARDSTRPTRHHLTTLPGPCGSYLGPVQPPGNDRGTETDQQGDAEDEGDGAQQSIVLVDIPDPLELRVTSRPRELEVVADPLGSE